MAATVLASRQVPAGGGGGGANYINRTVLPADVVNNNSTANTLADVTGLSFPVTSGNRYKFRFVITYTAAAAATGSRWTINGPTTSQLLYRSEYSLASTANTVNEGLNVFGLPTASNGSSLTAGNIAVIEGTLTPSASGTVIARFASEVSSSAITAKANVSYVEWEEITAQEQGPASSDSPLIDRLQATAFGYEDFYQGNYPNGWFTGLYENHAAGYITTVPSEPDAVGIAAFVSGGSTGRAGLVSYYASCIRLGGGEAIIEARVRVDDDGGLSNGTNSYTLRFGFMDDVGGDPPDGVYFRYTHSVNSGNWQGRARSNNSESVVNLDTPPITSGWQKLRVVVNADASRADFYIDGVNKGNVTSNIPSAAGRETAIGASIVSGAGASRVWEMDYIAWEIKLNR